jgi:hypothetical protein
MSLFKTNNSEQSPNLRSIKPTGFRLSLMETVPHKKETNEDDEESKDF